MPTTILSVAQNIFNDTGVQGLTSRTRNGANAPLTGPSLGQLRVTLKAQTSTIMVTDHCSIGVWDGAAGSNTLATPVELLFGGVSGFSIAANGSITSDWVTLACLQTNSLVVILDYNNASGAFNAPMNNNSAIGSTYQKAGASYNLATLTGGSTTAALEAVTLIETQAVPVAASSYAMGRRWLRK